MRSFLIALLLIIGSCASIEPPEDPLGSDEPILYSESGASSFLGSLTKNALERIEREDSHRIFSILVGSSEGLLLEKYYNSRIPSSPHDIRSATKSITAILVGIAIDRGILPGVQTSVSQILGPHYPERTIHQDLTIQDLLTMSSGKECDDWDWTSPGHEDRMYQSEDWTRFFLGQNQIGEPGSMSRYCTGGVVALGMILELSLDSPLDQWADEVLFSPLGIGNYGWEYYNHGAGLDTGGHLHITPRGLLTMGMMLLGFGEYQGVQIVSKDWVNSMWSTQTKLLDQQYGYLWWLNTLDYGSGPIKIILARGNGGQSLFLAPQLDLAVVITTGYFNDPMSALSDQLFYGAILPDALEGEKL